MKIVTYPNEILRIACESFSGTLSDIFLDEMVETMYLGNGVGLAAPQVNSRLCAFIMDPSAGEQKDQLELVINPVILERSEAVDDGIEGCLSFPGIQGPVSRARSVVVGYTQRSGLRVQRALEGFPARVFQHEFDHLVGVLYVDHIPTFSRKLLLRDYAKLRTI